VKETINHACHVI